MLVPAIPPGLLYLMADLLLGDLTHQPEALVDDQGGEHDDPVLCSERMALGFVRIDLPNLDVSVFVVHPRQRLPHAFAVLAIGLGHEDHFHRTHAADPSFEIVPPVPTVGALPRAK